MCDEEIIKNFGMEEITDSKYASLIKNDGSTGIYLVRLLIGYSNKYVYKIGKTTQNLFDRLYQLNNEYKSNGKIILIFYGKNNNTNTEKNIQSKLSKWRILDNYHNPIRPKPKELYHILPELYDCFSELLKVYTSDFFFESEKYRLGDDNSEYYKLSLYMLDFLRDSDCWDFDDDPKEKWIKLDNKKFWKIIKEYKNNDEVKKSTSNTDSTKDDTDTTKDTSSSDTK
jgi:hypothetical protein